MHYLAVNIDANLIQNPNKTNIKGDYIYEDLLYYCSKGGVVQDIILEEEDNRIIVAKRAEFFEVQKELGVEKINAILHVENISMITEFENTGRIFQRNIKELAEKERNEKEGILKKVFFFKHFISENKQTKIVDLVVDFYNSYNRIEESEKNNVQNVFFSQKKNLLELESFDAIASNDRERVVKYYEFLKVLNTLAPLRSVNGKKYEVISHLFIR